MKTKKESTVSYFQIAVSLLLLEPFYYMAQWGLSIPMAP